MTELKVVRNNNDQPTRRCPFHCGIVGFAKVGGTFCIRECEYFKDINPMTDTLVCNNKGRNFGEK